jgi:hypothetical protein
MIVEEQRGAMSTARAKVWAEAAHEDDVLTIHP